MMNTWYTVAKDYYHLFLIGRLVLNNRFSVEITLYFALINRKFEHHQISNKNLKTTRTKKLSDQNKSAIYVKKT